MKNEEKIDTGYPKFYIYKSETFHEIWKVTEKAGFWKNVGWKNQNWTESAWIKNTVEKKTVKNNRLGRFGNDRIKQILSSEAALLI